MDIWNSLSLLAQEAADGAAENGGQQAQQGPTPLGWMIMFLPIIVVWFVMFILPQNKERARRQDMLNSLKKNDHVVTESGILGTVSHISEDGKEVTLKVDDNTRIKFLRHAIHGVIRSDGSASS